MYLKQLEIKGFRNYREGSVAPGPGVSVVVGSNGAGKTSLLEAVQYSLCGRSFRTARDSELVREGSEFLRLSVDIEHDGAARRRTVSLEAGGSAQVDEGGGPRWEAPGAVLCFSPDDLQLVKGPPAERRRFLNEAISLRQPAYRKLARDYSKVLSQRNRFLQRARAGLVRLADISPWDRQLVALAFQIREARSRYCAELSPCFGAAYDKIAGGDNSTGLRYISQLDAHAGGENPDEEATRELEQHWSADMERGTTGIGTHRDDLEFVNGGKSMRTYGSQGEQRSAVLALLLAEAGGGNDDGQPLLLLDDVLSELDPDRRVRLLAALGNGMGCQAIITAADPGLIPDDSGNGIVVMEIGAGGRVMEKGKAHV